MNDTDFLDEFYRMLSPIDEWDGGTDSIKEIFEARIAKYGITQNQAEKILNMQKRSLEGILDRSAKRVDVINLLKLGQFLGLDTQSLLKLYLNEVSPDMVGELEDAKKKSYILSNFDIKNLSKSGFLTTKTDFNYIERRIVDFFGLKSIFHYSNKYFIPAFSKTKKSESTLMREFWVRSAYSHFESINNPHDFDRQKLIDLIPKIRPYSINVANGLKTVTQALYHIGLTVIYQPHLPTTQVRGATFIIKGKPYIVLTDLNKNYASVWFALMHEIHHVLYDFDEITTQVFHLTGEADLFLLQEDKADGFSRQYFLSDDRAKFIYKYIDNQLIVANYAKEYQIHSSLIYNFYCYDMDQSGKGNYWGKFRNYLLDTKEALKDINVNTFENDSIEETIQYLNDHIFNI